ncbi:MAG: ABC transporter ATP-binding protein [Sulfolobaceae archaeon]
MDCIGVENLVKFYNGIRVLDSISFHIGCGERWALIGPNGAGKSTTLKILAGLIPLDSGEVRIMGYKPGSEEAKRLIGYLPEDSDPFPALSVEDNLKFVAALRNVKNADDYIEYLLTLLDLSKYRNYKASSLSKGNKQKLAIAMVLLSKPKILLLDEPLNYLDLPSQEVVIQLLNELKDVTILVSTHIMSIANRLATNALIIVNGRIMWKGKFEELKRLGEGSLEKIIIDIMRGKLGVK